MSPTADALKRLHTALDFSGRHQTLGVQIACISIELTHNALLSGCDSNPLE